VSWLEVSGLPQSETIKTGTACAQRRVRRGLLGIEHLGVESVEGGARWARRGAADRVGTAEGGGGVFGVRCGRRCPGYGSSAGAIAGSGCRDDAGIPASAQVKSLIAARSSKLDIPLARGQGFTTQPRGSRVEPRSVFSPG
jgi:hypothetical protein